MPKYFVPKNLWNDGEAAGLSGLALLAYRSRLLAADRSIVNIFGGNTSSKTIERDHVGRDTRVLWVKGSGADMAGCTDGSFAALRLDEVLPLLGRQEMTDEEMVDYLNRCAFEPGRPRQSIETLLHAFIPFPEVDHTHPDAIIAIACTKRGSEPAQDIFGDRMVWVDYVRPGFLLSKNIAVAVKENPKAECVVMGKHGLVTWGESGRECYERTIRIVGEAEAAICRQQKKTWTAKAERSQEDVFDLLPRIRGAVSKTRKQVVALDTSERGLQMANTPAAKDLSQIGAACPDHLVHVKQRPLFLNADSVCEQVEEYRHEYENYFAKHSKDGDTMFDSAPRIILRPGVGVLAIGGDEYQAEIAKQLYARAIEVIEGAEAFGGFESLSSAEAFDIEYWPLELYKLQLRPPEKLFAGHVALVTGAGSGIGKATAGKLSSLGAHVCLADINLDSALAAAEDLERSMAVKCDVTSEDSVLNSLQECVRRWGGLDILVCSAGIASSAPLEETTVADWDRIFSVMAKGYFLPSREAFKIFKKQGIGGSVVFVTSKNAIAAGKNAAAYSAAKAAEQHLARCLAEEGGPMGVRVNCVLPDAVLAGSSIWDGEWRRQRAEAYGINPDELEVFYRNRTTLKLSVYPEDVAEAVAFLAGPHAAKTTGAALTVDGGVPGVYVR